jgi:gluconokinase
MVLILMGVSGSGKTTIGQILARDLGWRFYDADDFHPKANIEKMSQGIPLTDADRAFWLAAIHDRILESLREDQSVIIACSALKQAYRDLLLKGTQNVHFVYLKGDFDLIRKRLEERKGHYMKANLLTSQFNTLEEPKGVFTIDITQEPESIANRIKQEIKFWMAQEHE